MVEISSRLNPERVLKDLSFDEKGRWAVPVANRLKVVDSAVPPQNVIIKDDTFRESTNMPGAAPTNEQKLGLAKRLEARLVSGRSWQAMPAWMSNVSL